MAQPAHKIDPRVMAWAEASANGDALLFATDVLGFMSPGTDNPHHLPQLEQWQVDALTEFSRQWKARFVKPPRLAVKSGHGVGKTCFLSVLIIFVLMSSGPDTKVPVVANSMDQLRDGLWPEVLKWINHLPDELKPFLEWQKEKVVVRAAPEEAFAVRRTASKHRPEALAGMHARTVLAIFEEASGIPEETVETGAGILSTPGAALVCVGNPTRASGFFHKIFTAPQFREEWSFLTVNCENVPRSRGHIQTVINLFGKDSNKYRVRVLGEFPTRDDDVVIPLEDIEAACKRRVDAIHVHPVWGLDVSRFGDDRTPLIKRQGNKLLAAPIVWRNLDTTQIKNKIVHEYRYTPNDEKPKAIAVDVIGIGAGVFDQLSRNPELAADGVDIIGVNVSESAPNDDTCHRLRDELWFKGRAWFKSQDCTFFGVAKNADEQAKIDELVLELAAPTYDFTGSDKLIVASKDDMKKLVGRSPDLADAFLVSLACPVYPRESDVHKVRSRRSHFDQRDPWAA